MMNPTQARCALDRILSFFQNLLAYLADVGHCIDGVGGRGAGGEGGLKNQLIMDCKKYNTIASVT